MSFSSRMRNQITARRFLSGVLVLSALMTLGCVRSLQGGSNPEIKKDLSLSELLALYDLRYGHLVGYKTLARIEVDNETIGRHQFSAALSFSGQEGLRLRGFDPFGGTLFDLVSREWDHRLWVSGEASGEAGDRLIASMGFLYPDPFDLMGIPRFRPSESVLLEKGEDHFTLWAIVPEGNGRSRLERKYWIERTAFRVERVVYYTDEGSPSATLTFSEYRNVQGFWFPSSVFGEASQGQVRLGFVEIRPDTEREGEGKVRGIDAASGH